MGYVDPGYTVRKYNPEIDEYLFYFGGSWGYIEAYNTDARILYSPLAAMLLLKWVDD